MSVYYNARLSCHDIFQPISSLAFCLSFLSLAFLYVNCRQSVIQSSTAATLQFCKFIYFIALCIARKDALSITFSPPAATNTSLFFVFHSIPFFLPVPFLSFPRPHAASVCMDNSAEERFLTMRVNPGPAHAPAPCSSCSS